MGRYENGVCECGYHKSVARDADNYFTFESDVCPVCRGSAQYMRIQNAQDEQERKSRGEKAPPGTPDPADGRHTHARIMSPSEVEARRSSSP